MRDYVEGLLEAHTLAFGVEVEVEAYIGPASDKVTVAIDEHRERRQVHPRPVLGGHAY